MRFRKWSVRKLRRRPRSCDKIDNNNHNKTSTLSSVKEDRCSTSTNDSKRTLTDSSSSVDKAKVIAERNSVSSDDSTNADPKGNFTVRRKILKRSQNDPSDADRHAKNATVCEEVACDESLQDVHSPDDKRKLQVSATDANALLAGESENDYNRYANDTKDNSEGISENKDSRSETHCNERAESDVLMFGCDVPKPAIDGNLELVSSDQDSTAGEDEEFTDEEDIENLHPDMLLYKAAAAHNLPVMCAALAAGADKLWSNVDDKSRNALHQAIISVHIFISCIHILHVLYYIILYVFGVYIVHRIDIETSVI